MTIQLTAANKPFPFCFNFFFSFWFFILFFIFFYFLSQVAKHRKPRKVTQYWIRYTCGVVGLSVCSMWLIGHSRLMGSPDIDNWLREARDSTIGFFSDHVEQPVYLSDLYLAFCCYCSKKCVIFFDWKRRKLWCHATCFALEINLVKNLLDV